MTRFSVKPFGYFLLLAILGIMSSKPSLARDNKSQPELVYTPWCAKAAAPCFSKRADAKRDTQASSRSLTGSRSNVASRDTAAIEPGSH